MTAFHGLKSSKAANNTSPSECGGNSSECANGFGIPDKRLKSLCPGVVQKPTTFRAGVRKDGIT